MPNSGNDAAKKIKSINPATLEVNDEIEPTPAESVAGIVDDAREAGGRWAALGIRRRLEYLAKAKDYVLSHLDETAETITRDNGKPLVESLNSEIYPVLDMFRFCSRDAARALRGEKVNNQLFPLAGIESVNVFDPAGVVGIISPWNFPFAIPMTQILAALTAGNTVVLKPAELTAWTGELIGRVFKAAGLPEGVVNVIQGRGSVVGDALVKARPDRLIFTGSVDTGKSIMEQAARTLTPVTLELGGKDPFIVFADADVERASSAAVWGAFVNAGQVCASVERVYVDRRVADRFTSEVVRKTKLLRVGNGMNPDTDMGPLISRERIAVVEEHIRDAVAKGARVLAGGGRVAGLPGWFFQPTVLADVNHDMLCMREETFGPTLPIMTFSGADEAIALANDSAFGLTASVWTKDETQAREISRRIHAGTVTVNNCLFTYGFAQCPWGGVKDSGIGRTHSVHGLYELTNIKNITTHRPLLREDPWWYPYSSAKFNGMKAAVKAIFCGGMLCRGSALVGALGAFAAARGRRGKSGR